MPVEGEAPACDVLATEWKVRGIGDEPDNREKIETLRRKLYAKAKAEPGSSGAATRSVRADQAVLDQERLRGPQGPQARPATWRPAACLRVKSPGEPDAGNPHVRFDERGEETERWPMAPKSPRLSPTLLEPNRLAHRADPLGETRCGEALRGRADGDQGDAELSSARKVPFRKSLTRPQGRCHRGSGRTGERRRGR